MDYPGDTSLAAVFKGSLYVCQGKILNFFVATSFSGRPIVLQWINLSKGM